MMLVRGACDDEVVFSELAVGHKAEQERTCSYGASAVDGGSSLNYVHIILAIVCPHTTESVTPKCLCPVVRCLVWAF